jgi:hypothetical protein
MNPVQRFPKWMMQRQWELSYEPSVPTAHFCVRFFDARRGTLVGYGNSVHLAVKAAVETGATESAFPK